MTQYELQPAVGVPVRRILGYQTDLALALAAPIRIQPFIPGKSAIGVEVPNKAAQLVSLKETIESPAFTDRRHKLGVALGADVSGHPVIGDLARMPHLLIAGRHRQRQVGLHQRRPGRLPAAGNPGAAAR